MAQHGTGDQSKAAANRGDEAGSDDATASRKAPDMPQPPGSTIMFSAGGTGEQPGDSIGPYKLLSVLGEGGFGTVFLAERREPHVQRVALKIIKPGMDSKAVIARFEQERQALAVMDHPNVAKVYDAGATPLGRPYFVMEHVQGEAITTYCDRHMLTIKQRLELFIPVCEAVQHAHHKGIIHRDIKPSNILVTIKDGSGGAIPKVIDFGVAKAISHTLTEKTIFTEQGQIIGTPEYMSPEQAEMGALDVDTRTDVYSLGVVLYELLTGVLPFDREFLRSKAFGEIQRIIREEPTPRPSTKLTSAGDRGVAIARSRQSERVALINQLRKELEWLPLKAMRKDRTERYATPKDLADDIRHYLTGQPLDAGPETTGYRFKKWVRRNKGPVAAVAAIILALTAGMIATLLALAEANTQRANAQRETTRALKAEAEEKDRADELEKVAEFQASQLSEIDATTMGVRLRADLVSRKRNAMTQARHDDAEVAKAIDDLEKSLAGVNFTDAALKTLDENIFDRALKAIDTQFADQPRVKAQLLQTLAETMYTLGLLDRATAPQKEALAIRRRVLGDEHPDTLASINNMATLLQDQGKLDQAEPYYREALAIRRRVLGDEHPDTLKSINNLGMLLQDQGKLAEAEPYYREALEKRRRVLGDEHRDTLGSINNMATLLQYQGKLDQAEPYYREAQAGYRRVLGDEHPDTLKSINNLGMLLQAQGKLDQAELYLREALEKRRRVLGDEHPGTLSSINNLGTLLYAQGKLAEAEPYFREALEKCRRLLGDEHPNTLSSINNMGFLLKAQGKLDQAEPYYREALEKSRRVLGDEHPDTLGSINNMATLLQYQGKLDQAEPYYREAQAGYRRVLGDEHPDTLKSINNLGMLLQAQGKLDQAEPYYREALEKFRRVLGDEHPDTLVSINNLGGLLVRTGRNAEALALVAPAESAARQAFTGGNARRLATFLMNLGKARAGLGESGGFAPAEASLLEAYPIFVQTRGPTHQDTRDCTQALIDLYDAWHTAEPSKGYDLKAAEWRAKLAELHAATQPATAQSAPTQPQ